MNKICLDAEMFVFLNQITCSGFVVLNFLFKKWGKLEKSEFLYDGLSNIQNFDR